MNYLLTNCKDPNVILTTVTDLSMYLGKVVTIEKYDGCYLVSQTDQETVGDKTVMSCYDTCEECEKEFFLLEDCTGNYPDIYTSDISLSYLVGTIVKIPFFDNHCFSITQIPYDKSVKDHFHIDFSNYYSNCIECNQKKTVDPLTDLGLCDPEKIYRVKCDFTGVTHQKLMKRKYGVTPCCLEDEIRITLDKDMLEHDLLLDPDPNLPEPYVESCCIQSISTNCGYQNSAAIITNNCNCEASENSPHDCHQYIVTTTPEEITLAVGNDDVYFNNKVFFAYYKCKETKPTQVVLQENVSTTYCVLGVPIKGYFANNSWVSLEITRGTLCEEDLNTLNCHNND